MGHDRHAQFGQGVREQSRGARSCVGSDTRCRTRHLAVHGVQFLPSTNGGITLENEFGQVYAEISNAGFAGGVVTNTDFSAAQVATYDADAAAASASIFSTTSSTIQRPVFNYNLFFSYGQSLSNGTQGFPALSVTQPLDNIMWGQSVGPAANGATSVDFVPEGDALFHPLIATVEATGGGLASPATVATYDFSVTGNSNPGETIVEGALNTFRKLWLQNYGLTADQNRLFVGNACGIGGQTIEALSPGASPELFNRIRDLISGVMAVVPSGKTFGVAGVLFDQGQQNYGETGAGATYAFYYAALVSLIGAIAPSSPRQPARPRPCRFILCRVAPGSRATLTTSRSARRSCRYRATSMASISRSAPMRRRTKAVATFRRTAIAGAATRSVR